MTSKQLKQKMQFLNRPTCVKITAVYPLTQPSWANEVSEKGTVLPRRDSGDGTRVTELRWRDSGNRTRMTEFGQRKEHLYL